MIHSHIDMARAMIDASFISQHRSRADITSLRRDIAQTRRAIAASRDLLKQFRQRKTDALREAEQHVGSSSASPFLAKPPHTCSGSLYASRTATANLNRETIVLSCMRRRQRNNPVEPGPVRITGADPNKLDGDPDGIGCEGK